MLRPDHFKKFQTETLPNKRDAAEFAADFVTAIQAVHRDASRETHALLTKAMMAMPPSPIIVNGGIR